MNFEILVEGQSELTALSILMPRIIGNYKQPHVWKIHKHRGIGKLPVDPTQPPIKTDQTLLHNLPSRLRAYGKNCSSQDVVVVLVDLDDREDCRAFKKELVALLNACPQKPPHYLVCLAIEELEAWFLGDQAALISVYPNAVAEILAGYEQDSQFCTWETLAEAIYPGGCQALFAAGGKSGKRSPKVQEQKKEWARKIAPALDVEQNLSPSFQFFRDGLRKLAIGQD